MSNSEWWPPVIGAKLREYDGPDPEEDLLHHVVSVFKHGDEVRIVTAHWSFTRRRWLYEVADDVAAEVGRLRLDGSPRLR